jgi:hypothetical protein
MAGQPVAVLGGTLQCGHAGNIAVTTAKARLKVGGADVLLTGEEVGLTFVTCQNKTTTTTPAPSPCLSQAVTAGTSTKLTVGGVPVLLASATGTTVPSVTPSTTGPFTWSVSAAGQSKLTAR